MMNNFKTKESKPIRLNTYTLGLAILWSVLLALSLLWTMKSEKSGILETVRIGARTAFEKDIIYRRWNAGHGGVYVPVTEVTQPNPYLDVPEREITTPSGIKLTKINPAYMTRQVHEIAMKTSGIKGHITSLNPINPANIPDPWETQALKIFETGVKEVSSVEKMDGKTYMRLMRPLVTEKGCLKCHAAQGYKLGDIRGGISASLPMASLIAIERSHILKLSVGHGLLWLTGLFGIRFGMRRLDQQIYKRIGAEQALRENEEKYRSVVEGSIQGIFIHQESIIQFINQAAVKMFGYERADELMGKNLYEILIEPEEWPELKERDQILLSGKTNPVHPGWKGIRKDGTRIWIQSSVSPILWKNKPAVLSFYFDVTETKQVGEALHESEGKYRTILENIEDGYYEVDLAGNLTFFNEPLCNMFGYTEDELMGLNYREYMDEKNAKKVFEVFSNVFTAGKSIKRIEYAVEKDGNRKEVESSVSLMRDSEGQPIGFRGVTRDITERRLAEEEKKKLQTQLQQVQKLEAVGTLAGGIAHDFNNLLMGIQGNTSLIRLDFDSSHPNYEKLRTIENLVQSGSKLTSQLLGYARKGRYEVKPIVLNQLIEESSRTFERTRKEITIQRELCEDLFAIEVDQGQIEQVLLNLYINAADAMPGGGDLKLKTMNITHEDIKDKLFDPKPGNYVLLTVTDFGVGMDKKTEARIFEPFFTTKEMGRGTGLGLASAYGIIKAHGGYIDVESEVGQGTTFSIYLPASEKEMAKEKEFSEDILKGTETVLFVDDEDIIIDVGEQMLKAIGYKVILAGSGKKAIEVYKKNMDKINMVILDMIMPGIGGGEAYDRMKEINPDIKVLLSSGYSIDGQATEILERGCNGFIQKPFNIKELSQKLREILDKEKS